MSISSAFKCIFVIYLVALNSVVCSKNQLYTHVQTLIFIIIRNKLHISMYKHNALYDIIIKKCHIYLHKMKRKMLRKTIFRIFLNMFTYNILSR